MESRKLPDLEGWTNRHLPDLVDAACATAGERIPMYRDQKLVPEPELKVSIDRNLRALVAALHDSDHRFDPAIAVDTGRDRARQGVPLPEVLQVYRIGITTLWTALVDYVHTLDDPAAVDALLAVTGVMWQLSDRQANAITEGYREATAELLVAQHRRRSALVEALLTGQPGPDSSPWEAASLLGLPPDGYVVVVAADTRGMAQESLPGIEKKLAEIGVVSGWRLAPTQQFGVISLQIDRFDRVLDILRRTARSRVGVSPPYRQLSETPRARYLAQAALSAIAPGTVEVRPFARSPLAALVVCDPSEGRRLARQVLGRVLDLPADDRATLLDTFDAYVAEQGSTDKAAKVLYCHPNTVRYRLRRLQELSRRSLSDPLGVAELATAAYFVRLSPIADVDSGFEPESADPGPPA